MLLLFVGAPLSAQQSPRPAQGKSTAAPGATKTGQSTPKRLTREDAIKNAATLQKHTNIALLVGIGDYDRALTGLPPLKYPVPDIAAIGGVLKQEGYEVALLTDQAATAGGIRETFRELSKALDQGEGTFLFYFSGHGFRSGTENFLATFGTSAADLASQGLSLSEVQKMLLATGAKRRMAFVDACRNDPSDTRSVGAPARSFQELKESEGLRVLYSTAPGEVSYEDDGLQHGVFSYFLLEGLRGKAANSADPLITFDDLRDYVTHEMTSYGITRRRVQKPYQLGESSGDFLLAKRPDASAQAAVPLTVATTTPLQTPPPAQAIQPQSAPPAPRQTASVDPNASAGIASIKSASGSLDALPQVWRNVATNNLYRFRFDSDHLVIYQLQGNQVVADLTLKRDKKDSKKDKYAGTTSLSPCKGGGQMEVTSWSPTRIEAYIEVPDTQNVCGSGNISISLLRGLLRKFARRMPYLLGESTASIRHKNPVPSQSAMLQKMLTNC